MAIFRLLTWLILEVTDVVVVSGGVGVVVMELDSTTAVELVTGVIAFGNVVLGIILIP